MILMESSIYASMCAQISGMKTIAQFAIESVLETVYRRKRVRGVHLISAKFPLSSYLRHTMYYAGNTAVI